MAGFLEWIDARFCHHRAAGGMGVTKTQALRGENSKHGVVVKLDASAKITRLKTCKESQKPGVALH
jgi:hypothetical protein